MAPRSLHFFVAQQLLSVLVRSDSLVYGQFGGCVNTASGVTNPAQLTPIIDTSEICKADGAPVSSTLDDGSWMRSGKSVNVGASGSTTGQCQKHGWNPYPTNCADFGTELRNIQHVVIYETLPSGAPNPGWPYLHLTNESGGTVYLQSINSNIADSTNGPFPFLLTAAGVHDFRHAVVTTATACNIQPTNHPESHRQVNVMACRPEWWYEQDPQGNFIPGGDNYHVPDGPIDINIPPGYESAESAVRAAAAAWATALGRVINVHVGTTCTGGSGLCVSLKNDHGTLPNDTGCASLGTTGVDIAGGWTNTVSVRLEPTWQGVDSGRLQRIVAHELGHYFGLWNRQDATCGTNDTIMQEIPPPSCYSSDSLPTGSISGPTASDASALMNGTYGKKNRKICGW